MRPDCRAIRPSHNRWYPFRRDSLRCLGVSFSYFDPEAQRYVTRASPAIEVGVRPGTTLVTAAPGSTLAA